MANTLVLFQKMIESNTKETLDKIEPKLIKHRMMATTLPTDLLYRATIINTALIPVYNHALMALPASTHRRALLRNTVLPLDQASGWPDKAKEETIRCFQQNLIQRIYRQKRELTLHQPSIHTSWPSQQGKQTHIGGPCTEVGT
jgi:hypothetical protein